MNENKKFFSKIGFSYLALGAAALILQIILINIIGNYHHDYLNDINIITVLSSFCNYVAPFPIFYWLMKKIKTEKIEKNKVSVISMIYYIGISLTLTWIGNIFGLLITSLIGGAIQSDISNPVQQLINSTDMWLNLLLISLIGPIFEEIFFRKFLIDRTIKYGARISIILSATLFAFFHGNLNQFFYAFLIGGLFAYVYIKTGNILYPIILHIIVNLIGSVFSLIFANSVNNIITSINPVDMVIVLVYMAFIFSCFIIGIIGLSKYKKAKFNGEKTKIPLKNPYKTMFLNIGMISFIIFFIGEMIYQILG